jgi:hypothetical protein
MINHDARRVRRDPESAEHQAQLMKARARDRQNMQTTDALRRGVTAVHRSAGTLSAQPLGLGLSCQLRTFSTYVNGAAAHGPVDPPCKRPRVPEDRIACEVESRFGRYAGTRAERVRPGRGCLSRLRTLGSLDRKSRPQATARQMNGATLSAPRGCQ